MAAGSPHYDTATKRLEWGLRLRGESGEKNVNYTSRILGRSGVMTATLVSDTATLAQNTDEFKKVLAGFDYNSGQTYAEFKNGDKVAAIGLGALVLGGLPQWPQERPVGCDCRLSGSRLEDHRRRSRRAVRRHRQIVWPQESRRIRQSSVAASTL
jgi:hypothetical protein